MVFGAVAALLPYLPYLIDQTRLSQQDYRLGDEEGSKAVNNDPIADIGTLTDRPSSLQTARVHLMKACRLTRRAASHSIGPD